MTILDPRRHVMAAPMVVPVIAAPPKPAPRTLAQGGIIQANGGGSVFILPGATAAQLRELRAHLDAAIQDRETRA